MEFLDSLSEVRKNYRPYDEWEKQQKDREAQRKYLNQTTTIPNEKVEPIYRKQKAVQ